MDNREWRRRDLDVLWHPCTQMKDHERVPMIPIRSGEGVWLEDSDGNRRGARRMRDAVAPLADHPKIGELRQTGMILAIEMVGADQPYPWQERRGLHVYRHALSNQALLRPLGSIVDFMPPFVISDDEIDHLGRVAIEGIDRAARAGGSAW